MTEHPGQDTDMLAQIIRAAGRRPPVPPEASERVFAAASAALQAKRSARRQRWLWQGAAAAAVLLAALGISLVLVQEGSAIPVAFSDQLVGEAEFRTGAAGPWLPLVRDRKLQIGSTVRTGSGGRVGLVLAQGASLRLNEWTEVRLAGPTRIEMTAGTAYIDAQAVGGRIEVVTPLAVTREVGTQFEVRYQDQEHRVRVREGEAIVNLHGRQYRSGAGEQLLVSAAGDVRRTPIAINDASWEWVQLVARAPDIENRPLDEILAWVARETGRPLRYESPDVQALTKSTILHGSIRNLAPLPAAQTVLATTDLDLEILSDGSLLVKGRNRVDQIH
ncbi:MAG: FecR domain-containing protein [Gammaproteobacteria bacterium]|nr:FecR domain-containing protein [Gammaproteobacteria bacterium]